MLKGFVNCSGIITRYGAGKWHGVKLAEMQTAAKQKGWTANDPSFLFCEKLSKRTVPVDITISVDIHRGQIAIILVIPLDLQ